MGMDASSEIIKQLLISKPFKKLTGPPEHWLTTVNTKFWGVELKNKKKWENIFPGDLLIFHASSKTEYLDENIYLEGGIIGIGIVGGKDQKDTPEWIGEIKTLNVWPLLIRFSEIWWFGDVKNIVNEPIKEKMNKGDAYIIEDCKKLLANAITFQEMRNRGCPIPAQGSVGNISSESREKLVQLLASRLSNATVIEEAIPNPTPNPLVEIKSFKDIDENAKRQAKNLRGFDPDENEKEAAEREKKEIAYGANMEAQERANRLHKTTLNILRDYVQKNGIVPLQSDIDLYIEKNNNIFIFEVKSIHAENFKSQTRKAIAQILEYEYFDVLSKQENKGKTVYKGMVYSQKPPLIFMQFLNFNKIYVFWIDNGKLTGTEESMKKLNDIVS